MFNRKYMCVFVHIFAYQIKPEIMESNTLSFDRNLIIMLIT